MVLCDETKFVFYSTKELDDNCDVNFPAVIGCSHVAQIVTDDESVYKNSEVGIIAVPRTQPGKQQN